MVEQELARILSGRRDRILERYLTRLSPLTWPYVRPREEGGSELCMQDLATWSGIRDRATRRYSARAWAGDALEPVESPGLTRSAEHYVCAALPDVAASAADPTYVVVDVIAQTPGRETTLPARVHLYAKGPGDIQLVGLERPSSVEAPGR